MQNSLNISDQHHDLAAGETLATRSVNLSWRAHQLAAEIADADPNAVTQTLRRAATAQWRRTFLDLPK